MSRMGAIESVSASLMIVAILGLLQPLPAYASANPTPVSALAIDPLDPMTLYAGNGGGVFKSTDGGATWSLTSLTEVGVSFLAVAPRADTAEPTTLFASTDVGTVFKSTNGGATWSLILSTDYYNFGVMPGILGLAIDPLTPGVLAVGTTMTTGWFEDGEGWTVEGFLFVSTDGGTNWTVFGGQFHAFSCLGGCDDALWAASFTAVAFASRTDPSAPVTLYAAYGNGAVFTILGPDWNSSLVSAAHTLAIDTRTPATLYAGTSAGLYRIADAAPSWMATGLTSGTVLSLVIDPQTPTTLYVGTAGGAAFKSQDGGTTWTAIGPVGVAVYSLAIDPQIATTLYAGTNAGVYRSADGGATWSGPGLITWSHIDTVTVDPATVTAGTASTGTAMLSGQAPAGGAVVALYTSDASAATVPSSVTVPAGSTRADFIISTNPAIASITVTISGVYGGFISSAPLTVGAGTTVSSVSLSPNSVTGGTISTARVTLSAAAPAGGMTVALSSGDPAIASVPASLMVEPGATSATFTISTAAVTTSTTVTIAASLGGAIEFALLRVNPAVILTSMNLNPTTVSSGTASIGTVILNAPASAGGAVIAVTSSNAVITVVAPSVTVAAGATTATFAISTKPVAATTAVTISTTYGAVTRSAVLTVTPQTLSSVTVVPSAVAGGQSSSGTVTLSGPAPPAVAVVALASSNVAAVIVPATVVVPVGAMSATFTVATAMSCTAATATITASYNGVSVSTVLTVLPRPPDTVTIQHADYFRNRQLLRVSATSSTATAVLQVFVAASGALIGGLTNQGGGSYSGEYGLQPNPQSITVRSSACGSATKNVNVK